MTQYIHRVLAVAGATDPAPQETATLIVPYDAPGHPGSVKDRTRDVLAENDLSPSTLAVDFLRIATTAYVADMRLSRDDAFDGWTRNIHLNVFVSDAPLWAANVDVLQRALRFLTGDEWSVEFRDTPESYAPPASKKKPKRTVRASRVALLSGGLDSFIGAVDGLESGNIAFVAHHGGGGGATSRSQEQVEQVLINAYGKDAVPVLQFWFAPPVVATGATETTTRGRSLLFIAYGLLAASAAGADRLLIPENGMISLNVPLTPARLGSFSTRTTHPYYIALLRQLFDAIGIGVALELPYRLSTKGEMLRNCVRQDVLATGLPLTMSCSHPDSNRFRAKNPHAHCGRCVPCLIRRAATHAWGGEDTTTYVAQDLKGTIDGDSGSDLRAARIALARYEQRPPSIRDLLSAGPVPVSDDELDACLDVLRRGVAELQAFLRQHPES